MPIKVTPQQPNLSGNSMSGNTYPSQYRTSDSSRADDSGSGSAGMHAGLVPPPRGWLQLSVTDRLLACFAAEGRAPKRVQKGTAERDVPIRRPEIYTQLPRSATEPQLNFSSRRRQSTRDQKAPQGPRAVQRSPSKRYVADGLSPHPTLFTLSYD